MSISPLVLLRLQQWLEMRSCFQEETRWEQWTEELHFPLKPYFSWEKKKKSFYVMQSGSWHETPGLLENQDTWGVLVITTLLPT